MTFAELVAKRYSCRSYKSDPIAVDVLQSVLEAARMAPTAANRQPFRLIVIHTAERKDELKRVYARDWLTQAPIVICACGVLDRGWVRSDGKIYNDVDVAIVMDHLIMAATDAGLGTCWIGAFNVAAAREVLGLPESVEPIALTPLGYPADQAAPKRRLSLSDLVSYERW